MEGFRNVVGWKADNMSHLEAEIDMTSSGDGSVSIPNNIGNGKVPCPGPSTHARSDVSIPYIGNGKVMTTRATTTRAYQSLI